MVTGWLEGHWHVRGGLVLSAYSTVVLPPYGFDVQFLTHLPHWSFAGKFVMRLVSQLTLSQSTVSVTVHGVGRPVSGPKGTLTLNRSVTLEYTVVTAP